MKSADVKASAFGKAHLVLDASGFPYRAAGAQLASCSCPSCGERRRESFYVVAETGAFYCHHCGERGDLFKLVALLQGLDVRTELSRVVAMTAKFVGFEGESAPSEPAVPRVHRSPDLDRAAALTDAAWLALPVSSYESDRWLAMRGLDAARLTAAGLVRANSRGGICTRLFNLADGRPSNIGTRWFRPRAPHLRVMVLQNCDGFGGTRGTFGHPVTAIDEEHQTVVIVEGLTDTLSAALLWPDAIICGAQSAGMLPHVARAVAPRVRAVGGRLIAIPDRDVVGAAAMAEALRYATADHGFVAGRDLFEIDVAPHHDLNDALRAGLALELPA